MMRSLYNKSLIEIDSFNGGQFINMSDQEYHRMTVIDNCDDATNGDWLAVGASTNIRFDTAHKFSGSASLAFNAISGSTGFGVSKLNFADVASSTDQTYITMNVYFPVYTQSVTIQY